ncbi:threonine synthase [Membranihabitans maritimus]|uniref:threonine synthase n=1 Tax=Membranihabitans maritimus TaxID=2904244 RepID=UPI001F0206CD
MKLYSTNNKSKTVNLSSAVLQSLPEDNGLYMPLEISPLPSSFFQKLPSLSFQEISYLVAKQLMGDSIPNHTLKSIIDDAINFKAPLITVDENIHILELFHGPTLAFKDFGARFMSRLMNFFLEKSGKKVTVLVATSGDTGGAVASGFFNQDNIDVVILYPKGKVSTLQEKQLTTWGHNIKALEIDGNFDDCQQIVKSAFLDPELNNSINLSSANSINIARLIPQSFYYFEGYKQLSHSQKNINFCIPSGNFGNLTAGLLAKNLGLPINQLIAATNINDVVPKYLKTGEFNPIEAHHTLSNAMDIGRPSNFNRIMDFYGSTWNKVKKDIKGYSYNDQVTINTIVEGNSKLGYVFDPHTAIGYTAAKEYNTQFKEENTIVLSTAHPIKFKNEIQKYIDFSIPYPTTIQYTLDKQSDKKQLSNNYNDFKNYLLSK